MESGQRKSGVGSALGIDGVLKSLSVAVLFLGVAMVAGALYWAVQDPEGDEAIKDLPASEILWEQG